MEERIAYKLMQQSLEMSYDEVDITRFGPATSDELAHEYINDEARILDAYDAVADVDGEQVVFGLCVYINEDGETCAVTYDRSAVLQEYGPEDIEEAEDD